jgi:hypothetical protein
MGGFANRRGKGKRKSGRKTTASKNTQTSFPYNDTQTDEKSTTGATHTVPLFASDRDTKSGSSDRTAAPQTSTREPDSTHALSNTNEITRRQAVIKLRASNMLSQCMKRLIELKAIHDDSFQQFKTRFIDSVKARVAKMDIKMNELEAIEARLKERVRNWQSQMPTQLLT